MQHRQISAKGLEDVSPAGCSGAPAEIQNNRHSIEPLCAHRSQQSLAVRAEQIGTLMSRTAVERIGVSELGFTTKTGFDTGLKISAQLGAIRTEGLDAVVLRGVVTGRNHQTTGGADLTDQQWHSRGGAETQTPHLPTSRSETGRESRSHHRAAAAGIHPDQHRAWPGQFPPKPVANLQTQRWGQHRASPASNPICPEPRDRRTQ